VSFEVLFSLHIFYDYLEMGAKIVMGPTGPKIIILGQNIAEPAICSKIIDSLVNLYNPY
jgi:hypothetical protein